MRLLTRFNRVGSQYTTERFATLAFDIRVGAREFKKKEVKWQDGVYIYIDGQWLTNTLI